MIDKFNFKYVVLVLTIIIMVYILFCIYKKKEDTKEEFSQYEKIASITKQKKAQMTTVTEGMLQGGGSVIKTLNKNGDLRIYVEANLPNAKGGDFTNESILYNVLSENENGEMKQLMYLERDNDGFYKAEYIIDNSTEEEYDKIKRVFVTADTEKERIPIILGEL